MSGFGDRLAAAVEDRGALCIGIDPHAALLSDWGVGDSIEGLRTFALRSAEALAPIAAAIKPQSAFFERFGSAGFAVLEETIAACRAGGALVVLDVKRGDIGSTAAAYADAYLRTESPLFSDAITVSPYLGFGSLQPFVDAANVVGSGLFVLARTSNPEGGTVQAAHTADGSTVAQSIIDEAAALNAKQLTGGATLGSIGVVVGATVSPGEVDLTRLGGAVLAPGLGAQGASAGDVRRSLSGARLVLASSSRDILRAGPDAASLAARAREVVAQIRTVA